MTTLTSYQLRAYTTDDDSLLVVALPNNRELTISLTEPIALDSKSGVTYITTKDLDYFISAAIQGR
jgi:hypothetical protein